jgi:dTDP-4-amino-4,6-dideoxygalactose transaminase
MKYVCNKKNIYVTQPSLPPLEEFIPYLESIWKSKLLTNGGNFHKILEDELAKWLGVNNISLFTNGTIALLTALQSLDIRGEVITTPYSFVATTNALIWNGIKPVFVDICPDSLNLCPYKIESAITESTSAILAVHCYGYSCEVDSIQKIADKYQLKVIYDAAHAFGVMDEGGSILRHGDLSVLSFHATKVFNTFEGGAIVSPSLDMKQRIDQLKNFGFVDEVTVVSSGINGKMSEFNAALGLLQLNTIDGNILERKKIFELYKSLLKNIKGIRVVESFLNKVNNYSYMPILVGEDYFLSRDNLYDLLKLKQIFARRYFYPLISNFQMYRDIESSSRDNLPIANRIADQILCLPIYPGIQGLQVEEIVGFIKSG